MAAALRQCGRRVPERWRTARAIPATWPWPWRACAPSAAPWHCGATRWPGLARTAGSASSAIEGNSRRGVAPTLLRRHSLMWTRVCHLGGARTACSASVRLAAPLHRHGAPLQAWHRAASTVTPEASIGAPPRPWTAGVPFAALTSVLESVSATSSRVEALAMLSDLFRAIVEDCPSDLVHVVRLLSQSASAGAAALMRSSVGDVAVVKAIAQAAGDDDTGRIMAAQQEAGDLGSAAASLLMPGSATPFPAATTDAGADDDAPLTARLVVETVLTVGAQTGADSTARKVDLISSLLQRCHTPGDVTFVVRAFQGRRGLRVGVSEKSVVAALAAAFMPADASRAQQRAAASAMQDAYFTCPDMDVMVAALLRGGVEAVREDCHLTVGVPTQAMLATPADGVEALVARLLPAGPFTCEWKLDGERVQVHVTRGRNDATAAAPGDGSGGEYDVGAVDISAAFSRRGEDVTERFPDVVAAAVAAARPGVTSFVLEGEAVAWDAAARRVLPFRDLALRQRKARTKDGGAGGPGSDGAGDGDDGDGDGDSDGDGGRGAAQAAPACVFAFDLLYLNGRPLTALPLATRRTLLREAFVATEGSFDFVPFVDVDVGGGGDDGGSDGGGAHAAAVASAQTAVQAAFEAAIAARCEGLMAKSLGHEQPTGTNLDAHHAGTADAGGDATEVPSSSQYRSGHRSLYWVKLKSDYVDAGGDSLDLVPIGAYFGKGRRAGANGFGSFVMGSPADEDGDAGGDGGAGMVFGSVCRLGTGFTDADLAALSGAVEVVHEVEWRSAAAAVAAHRGDADGEVDGDRGVLASEAVCPPWVRLQRGFRPLPDVWLRPAAVWEVKGAELSVSPTHSAAIGMPKAVASGGARGSGSGSALQSAKDDAKGLGLRFPRFVRVRDDKGVGDATSWAELVAMYGGRTNGGGGGGDDDDGDG